jgi:hypothetical protein
LLPSGEVQVPLNWKFFLGAAAVVAPAAAFLLAGVLTHGHAEEEYFEAVSQILPVLLLALAIEQRYFNQRPSAPEMMLSFKVRHRRFEIPLDRLYVIQARFYALMVLVVLGLGEWVAVEVLATGDSSGDELKLTAGSLAAGFTALIVSALVGTKQTAD